MDHPIDQYLSHLEGKILSVREQIKAHAGQRRGWGVFEEGLVEWEKKDHDLHMEVKLLYVLYWEALKLK